MAKHIPMGPNSEGKHPHQGGRVDVHFAGPIHHTVSVARGMEAAQHGTKPHCLDKPPQPKGHDIAVHGSMNHIQDGAFNAGISKTAAAAALRGGKLPTDPPTVGKVFKVPEVTRGMKSDPERGHYDPANAVKVFSEATLSGSTRLPDEVSES